MKRTLVGVLALGALILSACGSSEGGHDHGPPVSAGVVPGSAADPSTATREIEIAATDDLRFDPASIDVEAGEIVTFIVHNEGKIQHEFVLGDEAYQAAHEEEMEEMAEGDSHHMADTDNGFTLGPGESKEITWEFSEGGEVLFGCHEPGHYEGGMVGTVSVS
jgi:uncharacterized cupredoxin-like copper-binding protein